MGDLSWVERERNALMQTYRRYPIVVDRGEGCRIWDVDGREYLDFLGGLAVDSLGHAPRVVQEAVTAQAGRLLQTSNLLYTMPQIELAEFLIQHSALDRAFFCNSGAEANEAAIKLARKWGKANRSGAYRLIAADRSFHGRTLATLAATANPAYREPFQPLPDGFDFVPFDDIDAMADAVTDETVGIILEPIQAEGGLYAPSDQYLSDVRQLCDDRHLLLVLDEVQTGVGRCGSWWAHTQWGIEPDVMTLAKGLASGFPIGATLAKEHCAVFEPGDHASTFGGNPLACAVSLAVLQEIERLNLCDHAAAAGQYFTERLNDLQKDHPLVVEVRGRGLLIGLELTEAVAPDVLADLRERGLVANALSPRTLRFIPPLVVSQEEIDEAVDILGAALSAREAA
jgi:acetylornithine aminotransferase/acetylornithine/N-succinyldiaminopimelate aminotransferase